MECKKEQNLKDCTCPFTSCSKRGICCECIKSHLKNRELPGCCFDIKTAESHERSFEHFAKLVNEKVI
jgi:hypothetical protein